MGTHFKPTPATVIAILLLFTSSAHAVMYKWIEEDGSVTYSNQPPANPAVAKRITVLDVPPPATPHEKRTLEILNAEREKQAAESAAPGRDLYGMPRDADFPPHDAFARDPGMRGSGNGEVPTAPRSGAWRGRADAARDPCLTSPDPKCYEKNRDAYVPYIGYSPGAARTARSLEPPFGVGANSGTGAIGSVGGPAAAVPGAPASPRRAQSSRELRQSLRDAKDLK